MWYIMDKKSKIIILILIILVVCGVGIHLFSSSSNLKTVGSKNITDMAGRTVQIPSSIDKVVGTSPSMTTVLYMIAPEKLSAINSNWTDDELNYVPSQYANLPVVGNLHGSHDGSYEGFISSKPDVAVDSIDGGKNGDLATVQERQDKFGEIPVVAVNDTGDVEKIDGSITFMGDVLGAQDKAKKLTDFNDKYLNEVHQKSAQITDKKTVYYAEGNEGLQTDLSGSYHGYLIDLVGGENVANSLSQGNTSSGVQVSMEQIIKWDPEVIITANPDFYAKVYSDPSWAGITAVKNHDVYLSPQSPFNWFDRPVGANMIIGVPWTAKCIYPDQYQDIDMISATQEFYGDFYHVDLTRAEAKQMLLDSGIAELDL